MNYDIYVPSTRAAARVDAMLTPSGRSRSKICMFVCTCEFMCVSYDVDSVMPLVGKSKTGETFLFIVRPEGQDVESGKDT